MKVAVMGAGAVGCYFGGMLARAGHDVVLIGRPQHVEAIERDAGSGWTPRLFLPVNTSASAASFPTKLRSMAPSSCSFV